MVKTYFGMLSKEFQEFSKGIRATFEGKEQDKSINLFLGDVNGVLEAIDEAFGFTNPNKKNNLSDPVLAQISESAKKLNDALTTYDNKKDPKNLAFLKKLKQMGYDPKKRAGHNGPLSLPIEATLDPDNAGLQARWSAFLVDRKQTKSKSSSPSLKKSFFTGFTKPKKGKGKENLIDQLKVTVRFISNRYENKLKACEVNSKKMSTLLGGVERHFSENGSTPTHINVQLLSDIVELKIMAMKMKDDEVLSGLDDAVTPLLKAIVDFDYTAAFKNDDITLIALKECKNKKEMGIKEAKFKNLILSNVYNEDPNKQPSIEQLQKFHAYINDPKMQTVADDKYRTRMTVMSTTKFTKEFEAYEPPKGPSQKLGGSSRA